MKVILNGAPKELSAGSTVKSLLNELKLKPETVAVELNLDIMPKKEYDKAILKEGDKLEIISFVGGG